MISLYPNQLEAVSISRNNDYKSGIHSHATGTGKSHIALELIIGYSQTYPEKTVLWLCEQKSILKEQFDVDTLSKKGYASIVNIFDIKNYTCVKPKKWYDQLNNRKDTKPLLVIINRSFLVSKKAYESLDINLGLIIHDECHSCTNKTTQEFYQFMLERNPKISCIGFSATPIAEVEPFNRILSNYSIYDAYLDGVVLPPKIKWVNYDGVLSDVEIIKICKQDIDKLPYKKIIIWTGVISLCEDLAQLWQKYFPDFLVSIDTSKENDLGFYSYEDFVSREEEAILFCAAKHREGSDVKNLDCCIFLDKVENRNPKTFVQSLGRVLRKDSLNKKKYGLIIDLKANSCLKICDRMNYYLNSRDHFPWEYKYSRSRINNKKLILNYLSMIKSEPKPKNVVVKYSIEELEDKFIYQCPDLPEYKQRLNDEMKIIKEKDLVGNLLRAIDILEMTNHIPHVTRGSCGSSLVCYLLGISNVDPIEYDIKFERFINQYRNTLPDIDIDFPHNLRDEVFLKLQLTWPNQVARISNHVMWHEKSALREALRRVNIHKQIPKEAIKDYVKNLDPETKNDVLSIQKELDNTFRHYSLHCGGIVFFEDGIPEELMMNSGKSKTISQIVYDKRDVAECKNFKIDILSSRAISQLIHICGRDIDFTHTPYDKNVYSVFCTGNNIGITFAESPLMRKALLKVKPKSIKDLAICLSVIRPAAREARHYDDEEFMVDDMEEYIIFDDDGIDVLSTIFDIPNDLADKFRRCLDKNKWSEDDKKLYNSYLENISDENKEYIEYAVESLRRYSFCKSHAYSYAQLIYKLAYEKHYNNKKFWEAALKHCHSSYRKWVHLYEARLAGVNVENFIVKNRDCSIYAENRRNKFDNLSQDEQLRRYGYWNMTEIDFYPNTYFYQKGNVYYFSGLIASLKKFDDKAIVFLCVGIYEDSDQVYKTMYIEVNCKVKYIKPNCIGCKGRAKLNKRLPESFQSYNAFINSFY